MCLKKFSKQDHAIFSKKKNQWIDLEASSNETVAFLIAIKLEKLMEQRNRG